MGRGAVPAREYYAHDERGYGWVMFAGVPLMLLGTHFFTANAHDVAGSLNTCGWVVLCIGVLSGNAIAQLMMIPATSRMAATSPPSPVEERAAV
jgi:hypothetical protein